MNNETSLSQLVRGEQGIILSFPDLSTAIGRLTSLGFTPSAQVVMNQNFGRGPLLVTIRGTCVALGRNEAEKILVERMAK